MIKIMCTLEWCSLHMVCTAARHQSMILGYLSEDKYSLFTLYSPTGEGQSGSRDEKKNKDENRVAQLESELKDMQDRLLNVSMQYAEVEAQREELVMELKSATAKKGRWF